MGVKSDLLPFSSSGSIFKTSHFPVFYLFSCIVWLIVVGLFFVDFKLISYCGRCIFFLILAIILIFDDTFVDNAT